MRLTRALTSGRPCPPLPPHTHTHTHTFFPQRAEAGLATLSLVGKVLAASGSDYLLAQGSVEGAYMFEDKSVVTTKLFYR